MRVSYLLLAIAIVTVSTPAWSADAPIGTIEAKDHVGKRRSVCGDVVAVGHAQSKANGGKQTFLHFDGVPPNCPFMAVIIGGDLFGGGAFYGIDKRVEHKRVCVTGYIKRQGDMPMMLIDAPNQLKIVGDAGAPPPQQ